MPPRKERPDPELGDPFSDWNRRESLRLSRARKRDRGEGKREISQPRRRLIIETRKERKGQALWLHFHRLTLSIFIYLLIIWILD